MICHWLKSHSRRFLCLLALFYLFSFVFVDTENALRREHMSERTTARKPQQDNNGLFAANGHMVHAGGQAAHWDIQNKENSNFS